MDASFIGPRLVLYFAHNSDTFNIVTFGLSPTGPDVLRRLEALLLLMRFLIKLVQCQQGLQSKLN